MRLKQRVGWEVPAEEKPAERGIAKATPRRRRRGRRELPVEHFATWECCWWPWRRSWCYRAIMWTRVGPVAGRGVVALLKELGGGSIRSVSFVRSGSPSFCSELRTQLLCLRPSRLHRAYCFLDLPLRHPVSSSPAVACAGVTVCLRFGRCG